jgi:hypothetical protein
MVEISKSDQSKLESRVEVIIIAHGQKAPGSYVGP